MLGWEMIPVFRADADIIVLTRSMLTQLIVV